jgi:hypothetical protein
VSATERVWIKGVGYARPTPPKPARQPAPRPAAAPVERVADSEPAPEPVEPLTPEQASAMVRRMMANVLASLEELRPHQYGEKISADIRWLRRRARTIRDDA